METGCYESKNQPYSITKLSNKGLFKHINLIPLFLVSGFSDIHVETHCILLQRFLFDDVHVDSRYIDKCDQCPSQSFPGVGKLLALSAFQLPVQKECKGCFIQSSFRNCLELFNDVEIPD